MKRRSPAISLGAAALAAIDTAARGYVSDQRDLPPDHDDPRLWGPFAGGGDVDRYDDIDRPSAVERTPSDTRRHAA